jgi:hypothetical protein
MKHSNLVWFAGFLEGKGFHLQRDNHKNLKGERGAYRIVIKCGNSRNISAFKRASAIIGKPITKWGFTPAFAEPFDHENRPAIFTDGKSVTFCITISCKMAQDLIKQIKPFLTHETLDRLSPIIEYQLSTYRRCPITGRYKGKYRSQMARITARRESAREYARKKRASL